MDCWVIFKRPFLKGTRELEDFGEVLSSSYVFVASLPLPTVDTVTL